MELGTLVQYAGLDADWQHLALFKLAQMVRLPTLHILLFSSWLAICATRIFLHHAFPSA